MSLFRRTQSPETSPQPPAAPEIPHDRPGSPYVELPEDKAETVRELIEKLRREATALDTAQLVHEKRGEDIYRAPELGDKYSSNTPKYATLMLEQLAATGKLNFWDASIDVSRKFLGKKEFSTRDTLEYGAAVDRIVGDLGLEVKNVPQAA